MALLEIETRASQLRAWEALVVWWFLLEQEECYPA